MLFNNNTCTLCLTVILLIQATACVGDGVKNTSSTSSNTNVIQGGVSPNPSGTPDPGASAGPDTTPHLAKSPDPSSTYPSSRGVVQPIQISPNPACIGKSVTVTVAKANGTTATYFLGARFDAPRSEYVNIGTSPIDSNGDSMLTFTLEQSMGPTQSGSTISISPDSNPVMAVRHGNNEEYIAGFIVKSCGQ